MQPNRGAGGEVALAGAAEEGQRTDSLDDRGDAGKQGDLGLLVKRINDETTAAESHARSAMQHALAAGALLVQAKALVAHGDWQQWVEANCTISMRTASAYMRLATKIETLPDTERQRVADLPVRDAIRAISTPPEAPPSVRGYLGHGRRDEAARTVSALRSGASALRRAARELEITNRLKAQRAKSLRAELQAAIDAIDALTRLGEMLKATPKNTGAKGIGPIAVPDENRNQPPTLADLGIDKKVSK